MQVRNEKIISEDIDEAELQLQRIEVEARGLLNTAKAAGRDFSASENQRFNTSITTAKQTKQRIAQLQNELTQEQENKRRFVMQHHPSATVFSQMSGGAPDRTLPVNGIVPGEGRARYAPFNRIGKLKAFPDVQSAYDSGMWYRAIVAREVHHTIDRRAEDYCGSIGLEITNTATEGSGTAGGYVVPSPISSAIIEVRERVGLARQVLNVMPTNGDTLAVPKKTGGLTVYIVGEGVAITDSDKSWGSVNLMIKKRACLSYISQELSEDSLINMVDNVVSEQAYALALKEDDELINGTGASTYGGIMGLLGSIGSAGVSTAAASSTWGTLTMPEVMTAMGLLPDRYFPYEPSIICSHSFYNQVLLRLAFGAGGAMANEVLQGAPNVRSFMGYKCFLTSKMPTATAVSTKCMLFGAFNQAGILADRGGIRLQRSDDVKFIEDLIALKAVSRYDINIHDPGDSTNAGAYVALATHA